jgi:hypothetical protein
MDDIEAKRDRNVQYMRNYGKRKQLQTADKESLIPKKVPKTGSERTREYKFRKQQTLKSNASTSGAGNSTDVYTENTKPKYEKLQMILKSISSTINLDTAAMFAIGYGSNKI